LKKSVIKETITFTASLKNINNNVQEYIKCDLTVIRVKNVVMLIFMKV